MRTIKRWLANLLARWARRIYPESEEVTAFYAERMADAVVTGRSAIQVRAVFPYDLPGATPGPMSPHDIRWMADEPWFRGSPKKFHS